MSFNIEHFLAFHQTNAFSRGLYFRDAVLPVSLEAVERLSVQISTTPKAQSSDATKPMLETDLKTVAPTVASNDTTLVTQLQPANEPENNAQHVPPHEALATKLLPVDPSTLVQPISEHRPRTIHLPSKEVQEERIRERQQSRSEAHARDLRESERAAAEPASSPSSTNGAWSATTPAPAEHSPVTSADEEAPALGESPAKLSKDTQAAIDARSVGQPDSLLEAQKEIARLDAIGEDLASPDVQLRLEQEQAVKATRDAAAKLTSASAVPADPRAQGALIAADPLPTLKTQAQIQVAPRPTERDVSDSSKPQAPAAVLTKETTSDTEFAVGQRNHIGSASPVPGRMITRVSSGAMRHKSVSEIMGNSPKISTPISKRLSIENVSPMAVAPKSKPLEPPVKPQQRPKTEIVSSAPSRRQPLLPANSEGYEALRGAAEDASKDYLEPLFRIQIHDSPGGKPLHELLQKSSKVVSTTDQFAGVHEKQDQRILRRIYQLQNANRWSLRQMEPCPEPAPPKSHMDHLLGEMKWMWTDFRQERKTKKAAAKFLAEECVEWVKSDEARRCAMQVDVKPREVASVTSAALHSPAETTADTGDKQSQAARSPPGLDASVDGYESVFEEFDMPRTPLYANVPSSFFSAIHMDKDSYHLQDSDSFHDAIADLPIYMPFDDEEDQTSTQLLAQRTTPAVSKFCEGKILAQLTGPPKKRSRFDYEDEEELSVPSAKRLRASQDGSGLAPEQTDVALFDPENKLLRDRLHSNTAFRPPSEFPMPSSQFYEYRYSSQWVADDDQLLRRLAKEYSFNWSLIADRMSMELPSTLSGAADRRSPWECFERWVELESLPNEMRKTLYFKTWNQRLEAAQQKNDQRYQLQLQAQNSTPGQPPQIMRRRTQPVRVEKRRGNRYLHIVDAMRKLARKREQQAHKQAEAQKAASLRKQHENAAPKGVVHTPQEFSRLRHQKDVEYANHQEKIRQHMLAQQRVSPALSYLCSISANALVTDGPNATFRSAPKPTASECQCQSNTAPQFQCTAWSESSTPTRTWPARSKQPNAQSGFSAGQPGFTAQRTPCCSSYRHAEQHSTGPNATEHAWRKQRTTSPAAREHSTEDGSGSTASSTDEECAVVRSTVSNASAQPREPRRRAWTKRNNGPSIKSSYDGCYASFEQCAKSCTKQWPYAAWPKWTEWKQLQRLSLTYAPSSKSNVSTSAIVIRPRPFNRPDHASIEGTVPSSHI